MPTVTYAYQVNQVVWTIDRTYGVRQGVVKAVEFDSNVLNLTPTVTYSVIYTLTATPSQDLPEDKVFDDIDAALTAYRALILSCCAS